MLPQVAVVGAGPAGLLAALLLAQRGLDVCVFEQAQSVSEWNSRSYSINLNQRGLNSLQHAGLLHQVHKEALIRTRIIVKSGDKENVIERNPPQYAITRTALTKLLTHALRAMPNADISHGVKVDDLNARENGKLLELSLSNGDAKTFSHVIGADGKWSAIRTCSPFKHTGDKSKMYKYQEIKENSWGVSFSLTRWPDHVEKSLHVLKPQTPQIAMYLMLAPLLDGTASISWVLFNEILASYPWLQPTDGNIISWNGESENNETLMRAKELLGKEFPFLKTAGILDNICDMTISRRVSWIKVEDCLNACNDRVVLIGDAGHCMTPSLGEGCNCALESAARLSEAIQKHLNEADSAISTDILDRSFKEFGESRLKEVLDVQLRSAMASSVFQNSK
ncbi:hypothetical protein GUITHDRAFT_148018 [Guillardia theta CCMP2712]|uniref:FAD-binding domain-containing protein n=1 Tax=Guillardia theta (strain CCMP2712) TaxID=905079 RepID=L1IAN7_GUITC|nr:hypothetical protein GUITHDRAFT_148018 [Guillardia theta CCMP2712]EKX33301.1 hypothetical protein GUITHDRAFT_148018 [Guillardia theta CCMP2712]|eukprot:XP_005820281.1 hypothetical protein GUITHDRAFT_148018 [Guillardia theta CCMP2712]